MRKLIEHCPTCGSPLVVTEMRCTACDTQLRGTWEPCRFCQLDADSLRFIEVFVKNRGNLKEMERELAESYWTLRARLNQVIEELGLESPELPGAPDPSEAEQARTQLLRQVQEGTLSASEAVARLAQLKQE
ncbi:MAG: DUF2089 domain-containing protein [Anaerolineae bacterium]|jgi:hypothetical protein|nr:DUF2089 domain-containing protein [Chloroflexota bacterium]